ncbi:beta-glucan synthesis-associated [Auriculariales sp. MPI-PUGE-AT-0066]|nr:beta-glucan synthesis-associated [Auriculariales sp. MPI-PUGE-AT-0066]
MSLPRPYNLAPPPQAHGSDARYAALHHGDDDYDHDHSHSEGSSSRPSSPALATPLDMMNSTTHLVERGDLGADFGPYPTEIVDLQRNSTTRYSAAYTGSETHDNPHEKAALLAVGVGTFPKTNAVPADWPVMKEVGARVDGDGDDDLVAPTTWRGHLRNVFSTRGAVNVLVLILLVLGILGLFVIWPIVSFVVNPKNDLGMQLMNGTGQISNPLKMREIVDPDTPDDVKSRTGFDGKTYKLVFSDEFNVDNRTFLEGEDPYWEAVDLHYWPTNDLEWYDPGQIHTEGGKLVITIDQKSNHDLDYISGMLQSWNKFCFTNGYIEVSLSLPGTPEVSGFWPAVWTMGNLGRPGYGASTEGTWPYSYEACDPGTLKNQTAPGGTPLTQADGKGLSYLAGQKLSSCTCKGEDHPGPDPSVARSSPEIDVLEATVEGGEGIASLSFQAAPFNADYKFNNASPAAILEDPSTTKFNSYLGAEFQQALSALSTFGAAPYGGQAYQTFGMEYHSGDDDGYMTWAIGSQKRFTLHSEALIGDETSGISKRIVPKEPMSIIINLGMAEQFQKVDTANLQFPAKFLIDYVRVYQREGEENVGCEPKGYPTQDYIQSHLNAYSNVNLTTWADAGYTFPKNSLIDQC